MRNAKGIFVPTLTIIVFGALVFAAFLYATNKPISRSLKVGETQLALIDKYHEGEKALFFIDQSAKYALYDSIVDFGKTGGVGSDCVNSGVSNNYRIWSLNCKPNKNKFAIVFKDNFETYLKFYPETIPFEYKYNFNEDIIGSALGEIILYVGEEREEKVIEEEFDVEANINFIRNNNQYNKEILAASEKYGVDPVIIKSIIAQESRFNTFDISEDGAKGLMQLMPPLISDLSNSKTEVGRKCNLIIRNVFDAEQNINGGTCYFSYLLNKYNGDVDLALAAYNAGPGAVKDKIPDFKETKDFVSKVNNYINGYSGGGKKVIKVYVRKKTLDVFATYSVKGNFKQRVDYDFSDYDNIYDFVSKKEVVDCLRNVRVTVDDSKEEELKTCIGNYDVVNVKKEDNFVKVDLETKQKILNKGVIIKFILDLDGFMV